jgi:SPIRAL1-like protein
VSVLAVKTKTTTSSLGPPSSSTKNNTNTGNSTTTLNRVPLSNENNNNNNYVRSNSQNVGNFLTGRNSSRVLAPPGGASSGIF